MQNKTSAENINNYSEFIDDLIIFGDFQMWDYDINSKKLIIKSKNASNSYFNEDIEDVPDYFIKNSYISSESLNDYNEIFQKLFEGEKQFEKDIWVNLPGSFAPKCLKVHCKNTFNSKGKPVLAHCIVKNITDTVNAEKNFRHRANSLIRANIESVASFSVNISKNLCNNASTGVTSLQGLLSCTTFDSLITKIVELIPDRSEGIRFVNSFSRGSLISSFENGKFSVSYEHHLKIKAPKDEWIETIVDIFKNPLTNEVEAALSLKSIQNKKIIEDMFEGIITKAYNFVGLIYLRSDSFVLIDKNSNSLKEKQGFINELKEYINIRIENTAEKERVLSSLSLQGIINNVSAYDEYMIHFNTNENSDNNHHIVLHFRFLSDKHDIMTVTCRDITTLYNEDLEQKKLISDALIAAKKANQTKSDFLSVISHDIRTPLSAIMGVLDLADQENDTERIKEYLGKAKHSSEYLLNIINDFVEIAKIDSGTISLHPSIYSSDEFRKYIETIILPICKKRNIHLSIKADNNLPYIVIDKIRINQIVFNLLTTACKYTTYSSCITLEVKVKLIDDKNCEISFVITNSGSTNNDLYNYVSKYLDENDTSIDKNESLTLGLSYSKAILDLMGGTLAVSKKDNNTTSVTVSFNALYYTEMPKNNSLGETIKYKDYNGYVFLLCEDDSINQEIAVELLKSCGAKVEIADNGSVALDMFKKSPENSYSAIFMDVRMPVMDGLTASKAIRNTQRTDANSVPIIALTANALDSDKDDCFNAGMNGYISKPIDVNVLFKTINEQIK